MTEYLVQPPPEKHLTQEEAEDAAREIAEMTKKPVNVYVLLTTVYP